MNLRKNRENPLLSVGAAAARAGVTVDTIRAWERAGHLPAYRTPGGQRRFRVADLDALLDSGEGSRADRTKIVRPVGSEEADLRSAPARGLDLPAPATSEGGAALPSPHQRAAEARADLEVLRARREAESQAIARQLRTIEAAQAAYSEYAQREARRRLEGLKTYGQSLAADVPAEWRAFVVRDIEAYITPEQFPSSVDDFEARKFVEARVQQTLRPIREELAQLAEVTRRQGLRKVLIESGSRYAGRATMFWEGHDAQEVGIEIRRELDREVTWKWTEAEVRRLVDDILTEWEDEADADDEEDWADEDSNG